METLSVVLSIQHTARKSHDTFIPRKYLSVQNNLKRSKDLLSEKESQKESLHHIPRNKQTWLVTDRKRRGCGSSQCCSSHRSSWLINYSDISQMLNILTQASDSHTFRSVSRPAQRKGVPWDHVYRDSMATKRSISTVYTFKTEEHPLLSCFVCSLTNLLQCALFRKVQYILFTCTVVRAPYHRLEGGGHRVIRWCMFLDFLSEEDIFVLKYLFNCKFRTETVKMFFSALIYYSRREGCSTSIILLHFIYISQFTLIWIGCVWYHRTGCFLSHFKAVRYVQRFEQSHFLNGQLRWETVCVISYFLIL